MANMVESALRAGGVDAERGAEGHGLASGAPRGGVSAPVLAGAGAVQRPLDRASVRVGRGGGEARLGARADRGRRRRSGYLRSRHAGAGGVQGAGRSGVLGEVGAIFGLEISRLARSNADLQRLLEFCGLTDTLIVDTDGIYDLHDFNDRLLLGLKAQMSEAELHMITPACRAPSARRRSVASCGSRSRSATSTTTTVRRSSTPTRRSGRRSLICSARSSRPARPTAWSVFQGPAVPEARLWRGVGGRAAVGRAHSPAGARRALQPLLRRGIRVRALPLAAWGPPGRHDLQQGRRAAPRRVGGPDPGSPRRLHHVGNVSREREAAASERHALRSAPTARGPGAVSGDRPLRRVRRR